MTEEQRKVFEKFLECWSKYSSLSEAILFEYAFKLGMKLAVEVFYE